MCPGIEVIDNCFWTNKKDILRAFELIIVEGETVSLQLSRDQMVQDCFLYFSEKVFLCSNTLNLRSLNEGVRNTSLISVAYLSFLKWSNLPVSISLNMEWD